MSDLAAAPEISDETNQRRVMSAIRNKVGRPAPHPSAFSYTVADACEMAGIGRTTIYKLSKEGKLRLFKIADRTLVCGDSLRALTSRAD